MNDFLTYFSLGFDHISDLNAYDHIVFVIVLCGVYQLKDWKDILLLITAFTIGHSITLALATFDIISLSSSTVEILIPITILLTAIYNVIPRKERRRDKKISLNYFIAMFFGLIHGLGFSSYLKTLLHGEEQITLPLLSFNLGLELGQLIIVGILLLALSISEQLLHIKHREWTLFLSGAAAGISLILLL